MSLQNLIEKTEALVLLKEKLKDNDRLDSEFNIELSRKELFWIVTPENIEGYGVGLSCWTIHRKTRDIQALNVHMNPNHWEEVYLDSQDPTKTWIIRFDSTNKKSILHLKKLLELPLNEIYHYMESPYWFGGHRIQLTNIQGILRDEGIETIVERIESSGGIKKLRSTPYEGFLLWQVVPMIKLEPSHFWEV